MNKGEKVTALVLAIAGFVGVSSVTTVSASAKTYYTHSAAKLESEQTYKNSRYTKVTSKKNKNIRVYDSEYLKSYTLSKKTNVFYSNMQATVKATNGKFVKYRYVVSLSGWVSGWIYNGYLSPKTSPKKVHNVKVDKTTYAIPKVLKKSVSNSNVNGFKHVNDLRLALLKLNKQINLHPNYYKKNPLYYANSDLNDYVALYTDIAYRGGKDDDQGYVDDLITSVNDILNYKVWNTKY